MPDRSPLHVATYGTDGSFPRTLCNTKLVRGVRRGSVRRYDARLDIDAPWCQDCATKLAELEPTP